VWGFSNTTCSLCWSVGILKHDMFFVLETEVIRRCVSLL